MLSNKYLEIKDLVKRRLSFDKTIFERDLELAGTLQIKDSGIEDKYAYVVLKDNSILYSFLANESDRLLYSKNKHLLPNGIKEECFRVVLDIVQRYIRENSMWPIPPKTNYLFPGAGFIDLGSYIGFGAIKASLKVGTSGEVIAVEADPEAFRLLQKNVAVNNLQNVTMIHSAITDHDGQTEFYGLDRQQNSILQKFYDQINGGLRVYSNKHVIPAKTVDTIIKESNYDFKQRRTHISFEINGAELHALRGLDHFLTNCKYFDLRIAARYGEEGSHINNDISGFLARYPCVHVANLAPYVFASRYEV